MPNGRTPVSFPLSSLFKLYVFTSSPFRVFQFLLFPFLFFIYSTYPLYSFILFQFLPSNLNTFPSFPLFLLSKQPYDGFPISIFFVLRCFIFALTFLRFPSFLLSFLDVSVQHLFHRFYSSIPTRFRHRCCP